MTCFGNFSKRMQLGPERLGRWVDFERDVAADYAAAFGKQPQRVNGIALMTDSNNTLFQLS